MAEAMAQEQWVQSEVIRWSDEWLVGVELLDQLHRDFVAALALLQQAEIAQLPFAYQQMASAAERQFNEENSRMEASEFPPRECHIDEHHAVMASIDLVRDQLSMQNHHEVRRLTAALADWFPKHMVHLDSALSHWLFKARVAGKPVVLRRNAAHP